MNSEFNHIIFDNQFSRMIIISENLLYLKKKIQVIIIDRKGVSLVKNKRYLHDWRRDSTCRICSLGFVYHDSALGTVPARC